MLSRQEYRGTATSAATPVATAGQLFRVDPTQRWSNTGVFVRAGEIINFESVGRARLSSDPNDEASPGGRARSAPDALFSSQPAGALIGQIGDTAPFMIGDLRAVRAPATGTLSLGINDDHLGDNGGEFRVIVSVQGR